MYYSKTLIVDTSTSLPSPAFEGSLAFVEDTETVYTHTNGAWTALSGGASTRVVHGAFVRHTGVVQIIPSGSGQNINFDTEEWDTDGYHDNSTNNQRLTVPTGLAGLYLCGCEFRRFQNGQARIRHFDSTNAFVREVSVERSVAIGGGQQRRLGGMTCEMAVGDYILLWCNNDSLSATNIDLNSLWMVYLGPV